MGVIISLVPHPPSDFNFISEIRTSIMVMSKLIQSFKDVLVELRKCKINFVSFFVMILMKQK